MFSELSTISFFSVSSGDHRDLHSFPTRRSSDLRVGIVEHFAVAVAQDVGREPPVQPQHARLEAGGQDRLQERLAGWFSDRKSTRLNSSHSQISYAVFCLKKKKTNKKPNSLT